VGYWKDQEEVAQKWAMDREFVPQMEDAEREKLYRGWKRAVERARGWVEPEDG
jgi:glycerol kinase